MSIMTIQAQYDGKCAGCGERFERGTLVFYVDDELFAIDGCEVDIKVQAEEPVQACDKCFLVHGSRQKECW
jgi:hypothetical protein